MSVQTIMLSRLFGGLYYNVNQNRLVTLAVKIYCVCFATILIISCQTIFTWMDFTQKIDFSLLVTLYVTNVVINLFSNGEYFTHFLKEIRKIDLALGINLNDKIPLSTILYVIVLLVKLFTFVLYCTHNTCSTKWSHVMRVGILEFVTNISNLTRIMMFELVLYRMVELRKRVEHDLSVIKRFEDGEKDIEKNLRKNMIIYKNLIKTTQKTVPMKPLVNNYL